MSSTGWKKYKLEDIAEIIGGGTPSTTNPDYWGGEIPWITPRDLASSDERFISRGERGITKKGLQNSSARLLPEGTVLLTTRAPIGYLRIAVNPICTNQGFKSLIPKTHIADNQFLFYLLKNNIEYLKSIGVGTTFAEISGSTLRQIEFLFPPLCTQRRIAEILSSLDDKIELNRQANATLEAIAQAIFKEWFVDFHFPGATGEMVESELGLIPKVWRVLPLDKIADFLNGLALQKFPPENENEYLPVIKIRELKNGVTDSSDKATCNLPERYIVHDGDLIFSWSGTLEVKFWVGGKGALNQHLFKVTSDNYPIWLCYLLISFHMSTFRGIAADKATTMGHIKREDLSKALCLIPDNLDYLNNIMEPLFKAKLENDKESQMLGLLRDQLIQKLMTEPIDCY
jgi:type I restriction enzyme S subunit